MNYYKELPYTCSVVDKLLELAHDESGYVDYYNFKAKLVPYELLAHEEMFEKLKDKNWRAGILKMDPYTCYNWHTDTDRAVSINMLLEHGNSHTVFGEVDKPNFAVTELQYIIGSYYLLNVKKPHMVLNLDKTRYLLSVEFL